MSEPVIPFTVHVEGPGLSKKLTGKTRPSETVASLLARLLKTIGRDAEGKSWCLLYRDRALAAGGRLGDYFVGEGPVTLRLVYTEPAATAEEEPPARFRREDRQSVASRHADGDEETADEFDDDFEDEDLDDDFDDEDDFDDDDFDDLEGEEADLDDEDDDYRGRVDALAEDLDDLEAPADSGSAAIALDDGESLEKGESEEAALADHDFEEDFAGLPENEEPTGSITRDVSPLPARAVPPPAAPAAAAAPAPTAAAGTDTAARRRSAPGAAKAKLQQRHATVRYYSRMNPQRVFPLLVVISKQMVEKIAKKEVDQQVGRAFRVEADSVVEVEPVLPGCVCHPPKVTTRIDRDTIRLEFHVVPHVVGRLQGAKVVLRQDHAVLSEVRLNVRVVQRTLFVAGSVLTFTLPFFSAMARHYRLDFASQVEDGFNVYLQAAQLLVNHLSPLTLTGVLAAVTAVLYLATRPRRRDAFWDIGVTSPAEKLRRVAAAYQKDPDRAAGELHDLINANPDFQPAWLFQAKWHYDDEEWADALRCYEQAFRLGAAQAVDYFQAGVAASRSGDAGRAAAILELAEATLGPGQMTGSMLFNLGCYRTRLGQYDRAVAALTRAARAGYRKKAKYLADPDLRPLQGRADFQVLVRGLK